MYYYQRHINDYRAHAAHLSLLEHGILTWLTDTYYMTGQPLPADEKKLYRLTMVKTKAEKEALSNVLEEFFVLTELGWANPAFDEEIALYKAKLLAQSENGKKGGRPNKQNESQAEPSENQLETQEKASQNPTESQKKPVKTQLKAKKKPNHKPLTNNQEPNINTYSAPADADAAVSAGVEPSEKPLETQEKTNAKPKTKRGKAAWKALLAENGITGQLADDYIAVRSAKNAPLTPTAMEGLKREAAKAGVTLEQAITCSTENNWRGFEANWLLNKMFGNQPATAPKTHTNGNRLTDEYLQTADYGEGIQDI